MSRLFEGNTSFNEPIHLWDVKHVYDMNCMFLGASSFNQPIFLNTGRVAKMNAMFQDASSFNQPIHEMDLRSLTSAIGMFSGATSMKHPMHEVLVGMDAGRDSDYE